MIIKRESPSRDERWVSIHDKKISSILCCEDSIRFYFDDGFDLIENGTIEKVCKGYVELVGCTSADFFCHIIKRKVTKGGARISGQPISLEKLSSMISKSNKTIEIFVELYDANYFHWRGELLPYKTGFRRTLAPLVTIETMDFFPMIYHWEEYPTKKQNNT